MEPSILIWCRWEEAIGSSKTFYVDKHNSANVRTVKCAVRIGWTTTTPCGVVASLASVETTSTATTGQADDT